MASSGYPSLPLPSGEVRVAVSSTAKASKSGRHQHDIAEDIVTECYAAVKCIYSSFVGLTAAILSGFALYGAIEYSGAKCETDVSTALFGVGIAFGCFALSTLAQTIARVVSHITKLMIRTVTNRLPSSPSPQPTVATAAAVPAVTAPPASATKKVPQSVVYTLLKQVVLLSRGAVVATLAWLAYELFRKDMWHRTQSALTPDAAPCEPAFYKPVSIVAIVVMSALGLQLIGTIVNLCSPTSLSWKSWKRAFYALHTDKAERDHLLDERSQ